MPFRGIFTQLGEMRLLLAFSLSFVCFLSYCLLSFKRNVYRVKHLDIPKIFNPLCPSNLVWLLVQPAVLPLIRLLPFSLGKWVRYSKWGWEYEERYRTHAELGDVWMQVTPSMNWMYVADPNLVNEIFHRREDFSRPLQLYSMLDIFGPNVGTVEGRDWQRHRKITGAAFNEQTYETVWSESLRQADGMIHWWVSQGSRPITTTAKDTRALSLNVLAHVGFRKTYAFDGKADKASTQEAVSFRQTLCFVLDNALLTMVVPAKFLRLPFLPFKWRQVGRAIDALHQQMTSLYNEEKSFSIRNSRGPANLMSSMVQASEIATSEAIPEGKHSHTGTLAPKRVGLTMDEIFGNIFVHYFAGHDTTAAVFAYTMYLLAGHPEVQDWIAEELDYVLPSSDSSQWSYGNLFPRLKRCLALLLETIRLYDPIPGLPKWTGDSDRHLQYNDKSLVIPARTFVLPSLMAVHTHPRYWGADSLLWRPARWIVSDCLGFKTGLDAETLFVPVQGTYFPWSEGQRNCPGKKFAQVEFVAVIATLLHEHRVVVERIVGENKERSQKRVLETVDDSAVRMLLQMKNPERVAVRWMRR